MLMGQSSTRIASRDRRAAGPCCYGFKIDRSAHVSSRYGISAESAGAKNPCARRSGAAIIYATSPSPAGRGKEVPMVPEVRILSDDEVRLLHTRALDILGKVGIKYESTRALDLLAEHGQRVDHDKGIAWLSPDIVQTCIESAPRVITLAGRDGKHDLKTDGQRLLVTTN